MLKTLETPRVTLRAFTMDDIDEVFAYAKNPNVGPSAGWPTHLTKEDSRSAVTMFTSGEDDIWAIISKETGRLIGSVGLHRDSRRSNPAARSLGYVLDEGYWGRGLATESAAEVIRYAFEDAAGIDIVTAVHYPFNPKSGRVMQKCGMRHEGTIRMATRRYDGKVFDNVCYSITREEWLALRKQARSVTP